MAGYNSAMRGILPRYGIEFIEIPRLALGDAPVSASRVRALIMLIYGKEATTQIENSVPYYSVSKWSSNTKMLLLHFHAP